MNSPIAERFQHSPLPPKGDPEWERRREMAEVFKQLRPDEPDIICSRCLCCDADWEPCSQCGGEGYEDRHDEDPLWYGHELYRCSLCGGTGGSRWCLGNCSNAPIELRTDGHEEAIVMAETTCPTCGGSGYDPRVTCGTPYGGGDRRRCPTCNGAKRISSSPNDQDQHSTEQKP